MLRVFSTIIIKYLAFALLLFAPTCMAEEEPRLVGERPVRNREMGGEIRLFVHHAPDELQVEVVFIAGNSGAVNNPFWSETARLPGTVVVFDSEKSYLGLLTSESAEAEPTREQLYIWENGIVGKRISVKRGGTTTFGSGKKIETLGPGRYFVQANCFHRMFVNKSDERVVGSSEAVEFEVADRATNNESLTIASNYNTRLSSSKVSLGEPFYAWVTYTATKPEALYNPFCAGNIPFPSTGLSLGGHNFLGLQNDPSVISFISRRKVGTTDFVDVANQGIVGVALKLCIGPKTNDTKCLELPPGIYRLQSSYSVRFYSGSPFTGSDNKSAIDAWYKEDKEAFKLFSQPVVLEVTNDVDEEMQK